MQIKHGIGAHHVRLLMALEAKRHRAVLLIPSVYEVLLAEVSQLQNQYPT
jgi:hypothetical protein